MGTEHAVMPGPAEFENELRIQTQGAAQGSPIEARLDESGPAGGGCHPGDKIAHCATSQISARSDYGLAGHNDVCLDVRASEQISRNIHHQNLEVN